MIRKSKKFEWPRKLYDKSRILNENKLVKKYGLKNKKEIWKTEAKIKYFRTRAKSLITGEQKEQQKFVDKLNKIGLRVSNVAEVLSLDKEDLLKRRLPSILVEKKFANAPKQARQMVVHKKILINKKIVNVPSYLVKTDEEKLISIKKRIKKPKVKEPELKVEETNLESPEKNAETKPSEILMEATPNA